MNEQSVVEKYEGRTDRELLAVLVDRSERVDKALFGNGQPGLISRMADVEARTPRKAEVQALRITVPATVLAMVWAFFQEKFNLPT